MLSKLINQVNCQLKIYNDDFFEYFFRRIFIAKFSDNYWILELKMFQCIESCSKTLWKYVKSYVQLIICINILFVMIFQLIKKFSNDFCSSLSGNIIELNSKLLELITFILQLIKLSFTWYLENNNWPRNDRELSS